MEDPFAQMREFITVTEMLSNHQPEEPVVLAETEVSHPIPDVALREDLDRIIFKLRAFMEDCGGEYAQGVEWGMQRAADMIENALNRHGESNLG
jgi:hypothetical protein